VKIFAGILKRHLLLTLLISFTVLSCTEISPFNFSETLRIDYNSIGDHYLECVELVSLTRQGEWSGPRHNLVDNEDLGDYRVIIKSGQGDTLYLKGFSTLLGEYRTTPEALSRVEIYPNCILVPMPVNTCTVFLDCRDKKTMQFKTMYSFVVNPGSITKCSLPHNDKTDIIINGDPACKVDLSFIAEGYTAEQRDKFLQDVKRFCDALFDCPPFDAHKEDFNVRAVMTVCDSSGTDHPHLGIYRKTALNTSYNTFGMERYLMTKDMKSVADAVWDVPTDAIFILVNEPVYGGGGIYNFYAIGSSDNARTLSVFLHEFGHSFGALADEYFYSATTYGDSFYCLESEPWEKNITTLVDFDSKWKNYRDSLYEGGGYLDKGIFRPANHCMMRDYAPFCPVCTRSIERNIDYFCDVPVSAITPFRSQKRCF